ncbi:MAG: AMP-binding protein [Candidatus Omnitrophota bacterium]
MNEELLVIHKLFEQTVRHFPEKIALQDIGGQAWRKYTYKELKARSLKVAEFLIKTGLKKDERAAIVLENCPEWAFIYLGMMYAGLSCVPLDPHMEDEELRSCLVDSQAKVIFTSQDIFSKKINPVIKETEALAVILGNEEAAPQDATSFSGIMEGVIPGRGGLPDVSEDDIASLIYTSGTTARPKGVLLSHKNICSNFMSMRELDICSKEDNILSILPLHHAYAFMVSLAVPLFLGATVTFCPVSFKPADLSRVIREGKVTLFAAVPQIFFLIHKGVYEQIKRIPLLLRPVFLIPIIFKLRSVFGRSLRLLVSGGARLEPKVGRSLQFLLGVKLIEGYGLTETSPIVTLNPLKKIKFGSVGKPVPDVRVKIDNPDSQGIGEVLIKGPNVMQGYFKMPEETNAALKDGWFHSGDLGYLDKDGYLFLAGRLKEVIVLASGKNIYPEELEAYFLNSPYVKEICILPKKEEIFGEKRELLYAIVVPDLEYFQKKNEPNIEPKVHWELENLSSRLPAYKRIMGFLLTKEGLARTALGKIKRYEVALKYLKGAVKAQARPQFLSAEDRELLEKETAKKIIDYLARQLKREIYLDSHLEMDLGIDSLSRVELGLALESLLSLKIPDEFIYTVSTVKELIQKIAGLKEGPLGATEREGPGGVLRDWKEIFKEPLSQTVAKKIILNPGALNYLATFIFKCIFAFIFRVFWLLRIEGKQNLPKKRPFIICPNHASYLDGFVVFAALSLKEAMHTFFLGYSRIFEHSLIRWSLKACRLIPLDTATNLIAAMQAVSFVLSRGKIVCIFPEGRRSIDERVGDFKKGIGILIKELDIPCVPVYIKGSHASWPRTRRLPRLHPLKIIFGKPVTIAELIKETKGEESYEAIARALREMVVKLI